MITFCCLRSFSHPGRSMFVLFYQRCCILALNQTSMASVCAGCQLSS